MLGGVAAVYRGHEGVRDELREWYETLGEVQVAISETRDLGERIVGIGRVRARGQEARRPGRVPWRRLGGRVQERKGGSGSRIPRSQRSPLQSGCNRRFSRSNRSRNPPICRV